MSAGSSGSEANDGPTIDNASPTGSGQIYSEWLSWVQANLGRHPGRSARAARAAVEAIQSGSGYYAAVSAAEATWTLPLPNSAEGLVDAVGSGQDEFNPNDYYWDGTTFWTQDRRLRWDGIRWAPFWKGPSKAFGVGLIVLLVTMCAGGLYPITLFSGDADFNCIGQGATVQPQHLSDSSLLFQGDRDKIGRAHV